MADELTVKLEHPITGEYIYPLTLGKCITMKDGRSLEKCFEDISVFNMPSPVNATFNTMMLQGFLDYGRFTNTKVEIRFGSGTYDLNTCVIYSNTTLVFRKDTVINQVRVNYYNPNLGRDAVMNPLFLNAKPYDDEDSKITGYNGYGNIKIDAQGGVIKAYNPFALIHGKNIEFNNIVFKETKAEHVFQIGSCKNVVFNKCEFEGVLNPTDDRKYVEMIQLDWATYTAMPYWLENGAIYDNNVNDHIVFNDCEFKKGEGSYGYVKTCVGSHGSTTVKNKNIYFNRCSFNDYDYTAIRPYWMENVYINDCNFKTSSLAPTINMNYATNVNINNISVNGGNRVLYMTNSEGVKVNGVEANNLNGSDCFILSGENENVNIVNVTFKDCNSKTYGILLRNCKEVLIDDIKDINNIIGNDSFVRATTKNSGESDRIYIGKILTSKKIVYASNTTNLIDNETNEVLYEGKTSSGSIPLKEDINNFKDLRISFNYYGNMDKELVFYNDVFYVKDFNLADDLSSTNIGFLEGRIYKTNNRTLTIDFLNQVNLFNGTVTPINTNAVIIKVYGKRKRFN